MRKLAANLSVLSVLLFSATYAGCSSDGSSTPAGGSDAGNTADSGTGGSDSGSGADSGGGTGDAGGGNKEAGGGEAGGGKKGFGEQCGDDAECETGACFVGGSQQFCTFHCTAATAATDCPNPPTSGVCNNQGYCRKP